MNSPRPNTGSLGCLGCFSIICLTGVLLTELAVVWWLNPWWFDRVAFWRGPIYEPHVTLIEGQEKSAILEAEGTTARAAEAPATIQPPIPFIFGRITADYEPAVGVELPISDRGSLDIPPGAIAGATTVDITPFVSAGDEMAAPFAGPLVDIRIGDRDHFRFERPVTLTLPYEDVSDDDQPYIAGWQGGRWVELSSRIDRENRTVSAELAHASRWGVLSRLRPLINNPYVGAVAAAVIAASYSSTGRGNVRAMGWLNYPKLNTLDEYFRIHYTTEGTDKVPDDTAFQRSGIPFKGLPAYSEHPLYVQYIGSLLERCRKDFGAKWNLSISSPKIARYNVFLVDLSESLGESGLGGPLFIGSDLITIASDKSLPSDELIRYTVAHELTHVGQDNFFNDLTGTYSKWFLELMAAYVGCSYWEYVGKPMPDVCSVYLLANRGRLLLQSMDKTGTFDEAGGPITYRYFIFPRWLDRKFGKWEGMQFLLTAADSWVGNFMELDDLDLASRKTRGGRDLTDLFTAFAQDFYHDDLWSLKKFPEAHSSGPRLAQAVAQSRTDNEFIRVTAPLPPRGSTALSSSWALHEFGTEAKDGFRYLPHLSAEAAYMDVGVFPKTQKAKLVIRFEPYEEVSPDLRVYLAEDKCSQNLPCQGGPSKFEAVPLSIAKTTNKIIDLVGQKGHPNRVTVLAVNKSLEWSVPGVSIQRWLLVPPANVQFERAEPLPSRRWKVKWDRVGLKDHPPVWGEYEILRRRVGQPDSEFVPLNRTTEEFYGGDVPTNDDYVFTVKVVDAFGNRSHAARVPDRDPFDGDWFGVIREKHGMYISESMVQIRSVYDEKVEEARRKIRRMPENTDYERRLKREEIEGQELVEEIGDAGMEYVGELAPVLGKLIRIAGLPAKFSIRRRDGDYFLTVKSVFGFSLSEAEFGDIPLELAGDRALKLKRKDVPLLSQVVFHSPREDFINTRGGLVATHKSVDTGVNYDFNFSWWFYRSGMP